MTRKKLRNRKLYKFSSYLRNNPTDEEKKLWFQFLRNQSVQFNRQVTIGNYIVDFYCPSLKLIIEIDGSQHFTEEGKMRDVQRDEFLAQCGYTVLRYSNSDINLRFKDVCADIYRYLD